MWISECYFTCHGGTSRRSCTYSKKIMLTMFKCKRYSLVEVLEVEVLVLVVDVLVAELKLILSLSDKACFCQYAYLTACRCCFRCRRSCCYSKQVIITEFKFSGYLLVEVVEVVVLVLVVDVLVPE
jgi:hypothetical protein